MNADIIVSGCHVTPQKMMETGNSNRVKYSDVHLISKTPLCFLS